MRYAQINNGIVDNVIESEIDPDGVNGEWVACGNAGPGWTYDNGEFLPPVTPAVVPPVWAWFIDIGPFFDRFGTLKMSVLTSTDAGIKAIIQDVSIRKWVDLKRTDVVQSLAYIGSVIPAFNLAAQQNIVNTPVAPEENLALKSLYFKV